MTAPRTTLRAGPRVRAPELAAGRWFNTGQPLSLAALRGRWVLLDFWTSGCVNCQHVAAELRPLERRFGRAGSGDLVVIGVHSPKFAYERTDGAVRTAIRRLGVDHPVLSDPSLTSWRQYAVKAWPTLTLVDPDGYVVVQVAGEGHVAGLTALLEQLRAERPAGDVAPPPPAAGEPGTEALPPAGRALVDGLPVPHGVAVAGDRLLVTTGDGLVVREPDGRSHLVASPLFGRPTGVTVLSAGGARAWGSPAVVTDEATHRILGVDPTTGDVRSLAGTGAQAAAAPPLTRRPAGAADLSSPAATAERGAVLWCAMAGLHQLWRLDPPTATAPATTQVIAGAELAEGLRDGPAATAFLAQPSALAADPARGRLWFVDAESSALRWLEVDVDATAGQVWTAVGEGLFDFGHADGPARVARLQHPLGLALLRDGSLAVADSYNGAVRRFDPDTGELTTLARGLAEPTGVCLLPDGGLAVVEASAGRVVELPQR